MKTLTKITGIILFTFIISTAINAQHTQWVKHIGGVDNDETAIDLKKDTDGNLYLLGSSKSTVDFDPSDNSFQLSSIGFTPFIAKYSPDGELIWAGQIGRTTDDYSEAYAMTLDEDNNIFITGYFIGTVDFDPGDDDYQITSANNNDMFVLKLNSDGVFVWAKAFDGALSGAAFPMDIAVKNSEVYVSGYFDYTIQFDANVVESEHVSAGNNDVFLLQLSDEGNYVWSYGAGSEDDDRALGIDLSDEGNVYITGYYGGEMDFAPGYFSEKIYDSGTFIVKYLNTNSTSLDGLRLCDWTRSFGAMEGSNIAVDSEENVYVSGLFGGSVNFNSFDDFYLTAPSEPDIYVIKLSNKGFQWALTPWTYDIVGGTFPQDLCLDNDGSVYLTGQHGDDIFIKKYSPEGEQVYSTGFPVEGECDWANTAYGIVPDDNNSFYFIADFEKTLEFILSDASEFEVSAFGGKDLVLVKHDTDEEQMTIVPQIELSLNVYPNPASDFIHFSENINAKNIQIFDIDGQLCKTIYTSSKIDVSSLNTGIYFLKFEFEEQINCLKFIKE